MVQCMYYDQYMHSIHNIIMPLYAAPFTQLCQFNIIIKNTDGHTLEMCWNCV